MLCVYLYNMYFKRLKTYQLQNNSEITVVQVHKSIYRINLLLGYGLMGVISMGQQAKYTLVVMLSIVLVTGQQSPSPIPIHTLTNTHNYIYTHRQIHIHIHIHMEIGIYNTYTILYCTLPAVTQALLSAHTGLTTGPVELTTGPLWIEL